VYQADLHMKVTHHGAASLRGRGILGWKLRSSQNKRGCAYFLNS